MSLSFLYVAPKSIPYQTHSSIFSFQWRAASAGHSRSNRSLLQIIPGEFMLNNNNRVTSRERKLRLIECRYAIDHRSYVHRNQYSPIHAVGSRIMTKSIDKVFNPEMLYIGPSWGKEEFILLHICHRIINVQWEIDIIHFLPIQVECHKIFLRLFVQIREGHKAVC